MLLSPELDETYIPLVDYLFSDHSSHPNRLTKQHWRDWKIYPITGGTTGNASYRVISSSGDLVVKLTVRDSKARATREFGSLILMRQRGLLIAPQPVWITPRRCSKPVVVMTWQEGDYRYDLPSTEQEWLKLIKHYVKIHRVMPKQSPVRLLDAVNSARDRKSCISLLQQVLKTIEFTPGFSTVKALFRRWEELDLSDLGGLHVALCRGDANLLNFARGQNDWRSVDWEYSGWGDPAFDFAWLLAHPTLLGVSAAVRDWATEKYCDFMDALIHNKRVDIYYKTIVLYWVARYAYNLCKAEIGKEKRRKALVSYECFLNLAESIL
jgi:aminoglycoside phosphotransferase (APT) family kinase protein